MRVLLAGASGFEVRFGMVLPFSFPPSTEGGRLLARTLILKGFLRKKGRSLHKVYRPRQSMRCRSCKRGWALIGSTKRCVAHLAAYMREIETSEHAKDASTRLGDTRHGSPVAASSRTPIWKVSPNSVEVAAASLYEVVGLEVARFSSIGSI